MASGLLWGLQKADAVSRCQEVQPVSAQLRVVPPEARAGEVVELQLTLTVSAPWHVYGRTRGNGGQQPMTMSLKLPEDIRAIDGWVWPDTGAVLGAGQHVLIHKLRIADLVKPATVKVVLTYQACNDQVCLPIEMMELEAPVGMDGAASAASAGESHADRAFHAFERTLRPFFEGLDAFHPG